MCVDVSKEREREERRMDRGKGGREGEAKKREKGGGGGCKRREAHVPSVNIQPDISQFPYDSSIPEGGEWKREGGEGGRRVKEEGGRKEGKEAGGGRGRSQTFISCSPDNIHLIITSLDGEMIDSHS